MNKTAKIILISQIMNSAGMQPAAGEEDQASNGRLSDEAGNIDENSSTTSTTSSVNHGAFLSGKRYHLKG